jgi:hypothetical protein
MRLAWAIVGSLLVSGCGAPHPAQDPAATTSAQAKAAEIDDSEIGTMPAHFLYHGQWEHVSGRIDGRAYGTSSRSFHAGDTAIITYRGTALQMFGVTGPNGGNATVAIDGRTYGLVNFFSRAKHAHAVVFKSPSMPDGVHTFGLIVNNRGQYPHRGFVNIDSVRVVNAP